jgi:hypothetical protein
MPTQTVPTPTPTGSAAVLRPLAVVRHGVVPSTLALATTAFGQGSLWVALRSLPVPQGVAPGPGEVLRVDPRSLAVTAHWSAAGWPAAIVVTDHYVWVAGNNVLGQFPLPGDNTVQQFDLSGTLLHTYPVSGPVAMAGDGDTVWVESRWLESNDPLQPGYLDHLHDGVSDQPVQLGGEAGTFGLDEPVQVVVCADGVYALSGNVQGDRAFVDRVGAGRPATRVSVPLAGYPQLGCGPGQGVLMVATDTTTSSAQQLLGAQTVGPLVALPDYSRLIGTTDTGVWIGRSNLDNNPPSTQVSLIDKNFVLRSDTLTVLGGFPTCFATDGATLWTVAPLQAPPNGDGSGPLTITAITMR